MFFPALINLMRTFNHPGEQPALDTGNEGQCYDNRHPVPVLRIDKHGFPVICDKDAFKSEYRTFSVDRCGKHLFKNIHAEKIPERSGFIEGGTFKGGDPFCKPLGKQDLNRAILRN
jgi:hypothetical protein